MDVRFVTGVCPLMTFNIFHVEGEGESLVLVCGGEDDEGEIDSSTKSRHYSRFVRYKIYIHFPPFKVQY